MLTKSKSTLLKSIAMIVTLIMVVCVCLTACADQTARDTAKEAKEIAEKAQSSLDDSLKDYVTKDEVAKMIEDALNKFMTGDGLTMVTNAMKSEEGTKVISDAVSAALSSQLAGLQNEEQVKALIESALTAKDAELNSKITDALSGYMTEESAKTLVNNALDEFLKNKINGDDGALTKALEDYKAVVSGLVEDKIGTDVSTYLKSEEAQQLIADCFSKYEKDGLKNAVEAASKIVVLQNKVDNEHWLRADKKALDSAYKKLILPIFVDNANDLDARHETDIVKLLYIINTCDQATLKNNVAEFEKEIAKYESVEQAAAKVVTAINGLGKDISGENFDDFAKAFVAARTTEFSSAAGKLGYVISVTGDSHVYFGEGNFGKLAAESNSSYSGFDMVVGEDGTFFPVLSSGELDEFVDKMLAPKLSDAEVIEEIEAALQAIVDKFGSEYSSLVTVIPATPDDKRTEEDESALYPERKVFNGSAMLDGKLVVVNYSLLADYKDILDTITDSAELTLEWIEAFNKKAGENDQYLTKDAKNWNEYKAVVENYNKYENSRYDNVINGVKEAYEAFIKEIDEKVSKIEQTEKEAEIKRLKDAYAARLKELDEAYWAKAESLLPTVIKLATAYKSPIYGISISTEESVELMDWAKAFKENYKTELAYTLTPYEYEITTTPILTAALQDLENQFNDLMASLDDVVADNGKVAKAFDEIDAKYWIEYLREIAITRVEGAIETFAPDYNVKGWDVATGKDIYDIAVEMVKELADTVRNYKVDLTHEYPYTEARDFFWSVLSTKEAFADLLSPMEKWMDTRFTAFGDAPTLGTATADQLAVDKYVPYLATLKTALESAYNDLLANNYRAEPGEDEGEYEPFRRALKAVYDEVAKTLNGITVSGRDYTKAIEDADAAYENALRALKLETYRMMIERTKIKTNQAIGSILQTYYKDDAAMNELYATYYKALADIVFQYTNEKVPAFDINDYYTGTEGMDIATADATACANTIQAIEASVDACMRDLAKYCYIQLLVDKMDELSKDVNEFYKTTIVDAEGNEYEDTYGLFERLKDQIDAILGGDADLSIAAGATTTTAYTAEYKAAYEAKIAELDDAVAEFKAMLPIAIEGTLALVEAKEINIGAAEEEFNDVFAEYAEYDYKNILKSDLNKLKLEFEKLLIAIDDDVTITQDILESAIDAALEKADDLLVDYYTNLDDYVELMDQYKEKLEALENKKKALINKIEQFLETYMSDGDIGRLVFANPDLYWTNKPTQDMFEKGSPLELGLRAAIEAVKNVKLDMVKDAETGEFFANAQEAYDYVCKKAIYDETDPYNPVLTAEGGVIWKVLQETIVEEVNAPGKVSVGTTRFVFLLNDLLNRVTP